LRALLILLILLAPSPRPRLRVVASVPALAAIAEDLLYGLAEVESAVPPGVEPHAFQATPELVESLSGADVFLSAGHLPVDEALAGAVRGAVLTLEDYERHGLRLEEMPGTGGKNVHGFWMDLDNALAVAEALAEAVVRERPDLSEEVEFRLEAFRERVEFLRGRLESLGLSGAAVVSVPAEAYAAEELGLEPLAVLAGPGRPTPGPAEFERLREMVESGEVRYVVVSDASELTRAGEYARELAESGAAVVRIRVLYWPAGYSAMWSYNLGSLSSGVVEVRPGGPGAELWAAPLTAALLAAALIRGVGRVE